MSDTEPHGPLATRFCRLTGCRYPIVQTGMGWVSGASLTAATSAAGGLGILAAATMTAEELATAVASVKDRTDRPFGVNLRPDQPDITERIALCARESVPLVSFAGPPTREVITRLHDTGILVMPTVGAPRHAEKMLDLGVDAIIAQGGEGGGHTGVVPTSLLLPEVVDAVGHEVPVLGAGGFHDGRGLVAALAWGADGVAMGTRFLLTRESRVPDAVKRRYLATGVTGTVVTSALDGVPQRVVRTPAVDRLEQSGRLTRFPRSLVAALRFRKLTGVPFRELAREGLAMRRNQGLSWTQVVMAAHTPMLTRAALVEGRPEAGVLPTGQVAGVLGTDHPGGGPDALPTVAEVVDGIVENALDVLETLGRRHASSPARTSTEKEPSS